MKNSIFCFIILVLITGCSKKEESLMITDLNAHKIAGTWKLTETYISPGGTTQWRPVEDGVEYTFNTDSTFSVSEGRCSSGTYTFEDDILIFNCDDPSQNSPMSFRFNRLSRSEMEISYVGCIEACIYRFQKQ